MSHHEWKLDDLIEAYEHYLRHARGVCDSTTDFYAYNARRFLRAVLGNDPLDLARLRASVVIEFVSVRAKDLRPKTMSSIATSLRSLFRFLRVAGIVDGRLEDAVPSVPTFRLSTLPRYLDDEQHAHLLASLDTSTPRRRRDRAIILCLSALGLRAGEAAGLLLEDIDWRSGTVTIRSRKTRRGALLPLPQAVGEAIAAYIREDRPKTHHRHVFVKHRQGVGEPLGQSVVSEGVRVALRHAGIDAPSFGAHLLRHTLATRLVRHGVSLKEIADVLGHSSLATTAIYAKTDIESLTDVALPWPEVTS